MMAGFYTSCGSQSRSIATHRASGAMGMELMNVCCQAGHLVLKGHPVLTCLCSHAVFVAPHHSQCLAQPTWCSTCHHTCSAPFVSTACWRAVAGLFPNSWPLPLTNSGLAQVRGNAARQPGARATTARGHAAAPGHQLRQPAQQQQPVEPAPTQPVADTVQVSALLQGLGLAQGATSSVQSLPLPTEAQTRCRSSTSGPVQHMLWLPLRQQSWLCRRGQWKLCCRCHDAWPGLIPVQRPSVTPAQSKLSSSCRVALHLAA